MVFYMTSVHILSYRKSKYVVMLCQNFVKIVGVSKVEHKNIN